MKQRLHLAGWHRAINVSQPAPGLRILFDQGVPAPLRRHLAGHAVETASELGWATLTDREMLDQAEASGIDLFITTDRNVKHQQALVGRALAILVLSTTSWPRIRQRAMAVAQAVNATETGTYRELEIS
jgi:predicted nuclease of predicted toxin-antitoxin system